MRARPAGSPVAVTVGAGRPAALMVKLPAWPTVKVALLRW